MATGCGAAGDRFGFNTNSAVNDGCGVFSNTHVSLNTWYHVVGVYDGAFLIYINGKLDNSVEHTGTIDTNDSDLILGGYYSTGNLIDGTLDDVRIYNRALSATEIKQLYNAGR
jgi:hypothetical protein